MTKRLLPLLALPLLLAGCAGTFTNLTPTRQARNADNLYPVEVQFNSRKQALRWHTIRPYILVGGEQLPMRPTPLMSNRWEGLLPVPAGDSRVEYLYKFYYDYNDFGRRGHSSDLSPVFELRVLNGE